MAIETHPFGGVKLSGKDAEKFRDQIKYGRPKKAAAKTMKRGIALVKKFDANKGVVRVSLKRGVR